MKQPLLITKSKVEQYLQLAIGYSEKEFERFIREAQEFDLKPLFCEEFYFEMVQGSEDEEFKNIIEGQEYKYSSRTYYHEGLEAVLSYFAYARFVLKSNAVSTSHGVVTKKTPNSEPISQTEKKDLYYSHRQDANTLFQPVKKYMERKKINYLNCNDACGGASDSDDIVIRAPEW